MDELGFSITPISVNNANTCTMVNAKNLVMVKLHNGDVTIDTVLLNV